MPTCHASLFTAYRSLVSGHIEDHQFRLDVEKKLGQCGHPNPVMLSLKEVLEEVNLSEPHDLYECPMLGVHTQAKAVRMPLVSFALSFMMYEPAILFTLDFLLARKRQRQQLAMTDDMGRIALHWAVAVPCIQYAEGPEPVEHSIPVIEIILKHYNNNNNNTPLCLAEALLKKDNTAEADTPFHILMRQKHALRTCIGRRFAAMGGDFKGIWPLLKDELPKTIRLISEGNDQWLKWQEVQQQRTIPFALAMKQNKPLWGMLNAELFRMIFFEFIFH